MVSNYGVLQRFSLICVFYGILFLIGVFLTRVYHRVQGIFIRGAQVKDMMDPSRIPFTPINFISSITYLVYAVRSSRLCIDDPEAHLSTLKWTINLVELFKGALAKSSDTTGPLPLLRLQELPLSVSIYSLAWISIYYRLKFLMNLNQPLQI